MLRRNLLTGLGAAAASAALSTPSLAQSAKSKLLKFVPNGGLVLLDPSTTTLANANNHGYYIFDTLYAVDSKFQAKPQMAEGHTVSDDKLTWDIRLRPGLKFHDGEPVLAKDCVASIKRWWERDSFGASLRGHTNEVLTVDDRTLRFRLKKPFGILPDALGHPVASPLTIMPERLASGDVNKPISEMIGSGPFRWNASEFVPGQFASYRKNTDYVPRQEVADGMSGGKIVYFDRVEWHTISDFATAAAALKAGEVDWWESVQFDLIDLLRAGDDVTVTTFDAGSSEMLRFNCGTAPFANNPALRRTVAAAITQSDITQAIVGADPTLQSECYAMYSCTVAGVEQVGRSLMAGKKDYKALAAQAKKAGYNGEKIVLLRVAEDYTTAPAAPVVQDVLQKIGMNVEMQSMDLNTFFARRASQAPVSSGGWSVLVSKAPTPVGANPVVDVFARGRGLAGYPGNYEDPQLEAMIEDWIGIPDEAARHAQMTKIQERLFETMPIVPLGAYSGQTAFRSDLTGYLPNTVPVPWNIRRQT